MEYYEVRISYTRLGNGVDSLLYTPTDPGVAKHTAVVVMHSDANYLTFPAGKALAERGYPTLCANISRPVELERRVLDVKVCVEYLHTIPGVTKVVLLGHSGGASLMSCYQAIAENGSEIFQGPEKIIACGSLSPLPKADGMFLLDSNWGNGAMTLLSLDPSVTDDSTAMNLDSTFDLADPANGYAPEGSAYNAEFIERYQKAQAARNERLINYALNRLEAINSGKGAFRDDEPICFAGASQIAPNNRMFPQDARLLSRTKNEWPLLHADGSETVEVIRSLRLPRAAKNFTPMLGMGAVCSTVKTYLTCHAVRTTEDFRYDESGVYGVDWDSSYCCTPGNVRHITVPTLMIGLTGSYEFLASEDIYNRLGSKDKTLVFVEGASHMLTPNKEAESFPGQFGDTIKTTFDYAAAWLASKFD